MTRLARPNPQRFWAWRDCVTDFGTGDVPGTGLDDVTATLDDFRRSLLVAERELAPASRESDETIRADYFWILDEDDELVGFLSLRHSVHTPFLRERAGHIGFSVRPSRRGEAHASRALGAALRAARSVPLERVLVICKVTNSASARTIEGQGGCLEEVTDTHRRYWVDLGRPGAS